MNRLIAGHLFRAACAALGASLALGCSTMKAVVDIDAPPERVWSIVTDVGRYQEWNPFFSEASGCVEEGASLHLTMHPVGASARSFSPTVLEVIPPRRLVWRGRLLLPGIFDGTHRILLEPGPSGGTHFVQEEHFGGLLVPFVSFDPYRAGWKRMNEALKSRAETPRGVDAIGLSRDAPSRQVVDRAHP